MGPLLYWHLRSVCGAVPEAIMRTLSGLYVHSRLANQVRSQALGRILSAFAQANLEALVLKGGALMHLLYPDPALRPMSDLDLLVRRADVPRAREVLADLGFQGAPSQGRFDKSLPTLGGYIEGVWVGIELHDNLFERGYGASYAFEDLSQPLTFPLGASGQTAQTLSYEDTLWHLCEHLRFHTTVFLPWRLIWVVDIAGMLERFADRLDWDYLIQKRRTTFDILPLVHALLPLPAGIAAPIPQSIPKIVGVGEDFQGWPRASLAAQRAKGWRGILRDTLWPSEWWLRLHRGVPPTKPIVGARLGHWLEIVQWVSRLVNERTRRAAHRVSVRCAARWRRIRRGFGKQP